MFGFGLPELLLIAGVVIFVFGIGKIPKAPGQIKESIAKFKKALAGDDEIDITPKKKS